MITCTIRTLDYVYFCCDMEQVIETIQELERAGDAYWYELSNQ